MIVHAWVYKHCVGVANGIGINKVCLITPFGGEAIIANKCKIGRGSDGVPKVGLQFDVFVELCMLDVCIF